MDDDEGVAAIMTGASGVSARLMGEPPSSPATFSRMEQSFSFPRLSEMVSASTAFCSGINSERWVTSATRLGTCFMLEASLWRIPEVSPRDDGAGGVRGGTHSTSTCCASSCTETCGTPAGTGSGSLLVPLALPHGPSVMPLLSKACACFSEDGSLLAKAGSEAAACFRAPLMLLSALEMPTGTPDQIRVPDLPVSGTPCCHKCVISPLARCTSPSQEFSALKAICSPRGGARKSSENTQFDRKHA